MQQEPIRVAYFCSTRELKSEGVDTVFKGNLENLVERSTNGNGESRFARRIQIALVVMDDDSMHLPFDRFGVPVHVEPSSSFRRIPMSDSESRSQAKAQFERRLLEACRFHDVDIVVSDRWMTIFGPTFLREFSGRMLNIHPANTRELPGKTPTRDALARAQSGGKAVTGVTVHEIDAGVDTGPHILMAQRTPIYPQDTEMSLRTRNYELERRVLPTAVEKFATRQRVRDAIDTARAERRNGNNPLVSQQELSQSTPGRPEQDPRSPSFWGEHRMCMESMAFPDRNAGGAQANAQAARPKAQPSERNERAVLESEARVRTAALPGPRIPIRPLAVAPVVMPARVQARAQANGRQ